MYSILILHKPRKIRVLADIDIQPYDRERDRLNATLGFSGYLDEARDGNYLVTEAEHPFKGASGSETKAKLQRCMR
jgi:hypothetical protein